MLRFTVRRTPKTAQARNTLGYDGIDFNVIAISEGAAVQKAQALSNYEIQHFSWRVTDVIELPDPVVPVVIEDRGFDINTERKN